MFHLNGGSAIKIEGSENDGSQFGHTKETEVNLSGCKTVQSKAIKLYTSGLNEIEKEGVNKIVMELGWHPKEIRSDGKIKHLEDGFYPAKIKKGSGLKRYVKIKPRWVIF